MSKLSRKRKRLPGPMTSTQAESIPSISNSIRPSPIDRNEEFFRRQLEAAINESKHNSDFSENAGMLFILEITNFRILILNLFGAHLL